MISFRRFRVVVVVLVVIIVIISRCVFFIIISRCMYTRVCIVVALLTLEVVVVAGCWSVFRIWRKPWFVRGFLDAN